MVVPAHDEQGDAAGPLRKPLGDVVKGLLDLAGELVVVGEAPRGLEGRRDAGLEARRGRHGDGGGCPVV